MRLSVFVLAGTLPTIMLAHSRQERTIYLPNTKGFAAKLASFFPDPNIALLPNNKEWSYPWWQGGPVTEALITYGNITGEKKYDPLVQNTILTQATVGLNFRVPECEGNDDQAWWALATIAAAEMSPSRHVGRGWMVIVRNVFRELLIRWDDLSCSGGMKFKIDRQHVGWHYKSAIANGLFFQLAARIAHFAGDFDDSNAQRWAERAYDWTVAAGLITEMYEVFDGTNDEKNCMWINHDQYSYNVGVFMYGCAVMAVHTGEEKWVTRTKGFLEMVDKQFINWSNGMLWEPHCEPQRNCNNDAVAFKGQLVRWLGGTAALLPELKAPIALILDNAATVIKKRGTEGITPIDAYTGLEILVAQMRTEKVTGLDGE